MLHKKVNLSSVNDTHIYLAIKMEEKEKDELNDIDYALIALPVHIVGRFIKLPSSKDKKNCFIYLDDIVRLFLKDIFKTLPYKNIVLTLLNLVKTLKWKLNLILKKVF